MEARARVVYRAAARFAAARPRAGVSLPAVQRLLGHAELTTTQVYVEVEREDLRRAIEVLDGVYGGALGSRPAQ